MNDKNKKYKVINEEIFADNSRNDFYSDLFAKFPSEFEKNERLKLILHNKGLSEVEIENWWKRYYEKANQFSKRTWNISKKYGLGGMNSTGKRK